MKNLTEFALGVVGASLLLSSFVSACSNDTTKRRGESKSVQRPFLEMHAIARTSMAEGLSAEAAVRGFVGTEVSITAESVEIVRAKFALMRTGGVQFKATLHRDLDRLRVLIMLEKHVGRQFQIVGRVAGSQDFPYASPVLIEIQRLKLLPQKPSSFDAGARTGALTNKPRTMAPQSAPKRATQFSACSAMQASRKWVTADQVIALVEGWVGAQNNQDFEKYSSLYGDSFVGTRKSGKRSVRLNRSGWLSERAKMFKRPMKVQISQLDPVIEFEHAVIVFSQAWATRGYADVGAKLLEVETDGTRLQIVREEMLSSYVLHAKRHDGNPDDFDSDLIEIEVAGEVDNAQAKALCNTSIWKELKDAVLKKCSSAMGAVKELCKSDLVTAASNCTFPTFDGPFAFSAPDLHAFTTSEVASHCFPMLEESGFLNTCIRVSFRCSGAIRQVTSIGIDATQTEEKCISKQDQDDTPKQCSLASIRKGMGF